VAIEEGAVITSMIERDMIYYAGQEVHLQYQPCNGVRSKTYLSSGQALRSGLGPRCLRSDPLVKLEWQLRGIQIGLSKKDIYRLDMASAFINKLLSSAKQSEHAGRLLFAEESYSTALPFDPFGLKYINRHGVPLMCQREQNLSFHGSLVRLFDADIGLGWNHLLFPLALILIPTAYGVIHLSALHEMFPTTIERALWKASCFTLIGFTWLTFLSTVSLLPSVTLFGFIGNRGNSWSSGSRGRMRATVWRYMSFTIRVLIFEVPFGILLAATILYCAARVFVVVESFISLRHVPTGVYLTPPTNFMGYIPHL
jgi:hypothetical protein